MDSLSRVSTLLAVIFVMNSHFVISACLNRDYCFSFFFFWGGGGGRVGRGSTLLSIVRCLFGNRYQILFFLLFSYTSVTELTQSLCKVK